MLMMLAGCSEREPADPRMVELAVRATVHAMPTPAPQLIEVTRVIEVEVPVEVTRIVEVTSTPTTLPTETPSPTETPTPEVAAAGVLAAPVPITEAAPAPIANICPPTSQRSYAAIPVVGPPTDHPDYLHGDLNLALRGYVPAEGELGLVTINGPTAADPPQLYHLFGDERTPHFTSVYRVHHWLWNCEEHGCRGDVLHRHTLLGMATSPGEAIEAPMRSAEIYGGGYRALVLYADQERITLGYTRDDSVANGYAVHVEGLCTDPNLLARYRQTNAEGRGALPAIRPNEVIGTALSTEIAVSIRDRGSFLDPRSRKDWWQGR